MGENINKSAVILAGSEIEDYSAIAPYINPDDYIICADSGFRHCSPLGIIPDLLVGDFDSIEKIPKEIEIVRLPTDKNYTDTTFCIQAAISKGYSQIMLTGVLGGRLDHTLANIQSLVYCASNGVDAYITDGYTKVFCVMAKNERTIFTISPLDNYYFSIFSHSDECKGVCISGAEYKLTNYTLRNNLARAVSNEFSGKDVEVSLMDGTLIIMLVPKDNQRF